MRYQAFLWPFAVGLALAVALTQSGCGTSTGNPVVTIDMDSPAASNWLLEKLIPSAYAAGVSQLTVCFKRVRFKPADKQTQLDVAKDEDNINFQIGERTLSADGSSLGSVTLNPGTYRRIELDFDPDCGSGKSVVVENDYGTFSTSDTISVKFEGTFVVDGDAAVALNPKPIIDKLADVGSSDVNNGDKEIKSAMLANSGTFRKK